MKVIYKYSLGEASSGTIKIELPFSAVIMCVKEQNNLPVLYAMIDTNETRKETRIFYKVGTGEELHPNINWAYYKGTVMLDKIDYVLHIFEKIKPEGQIT